MTRHPLLQAVLVSLWLLLLSAPALAQNVPSEVLVVLGKEEAGKIDPALISVKALKQPPFSSFKSLQVIKRHPVKLKVGADASVELPNGRTLKLQILAKTEDGRFKVQVSINRPTKKDYLPLLQVAASAGEYFFVAGQKHEGGILIIGVKVGETATKAQPKPAGKK